MTYTADQIPPLLDDMQVSLEELKAVLDRDPAGWSRGPAGKWTAGQHAEHVSAMLAVTAERLEESAKSLRAGTLGARPWRGPLQAWLVSLLMGSRFPRGGRTIPRAEPAGAIGRDEAFRRLDEGMRRHRQVAENLSPAEQARVWFRNPFIKLRWHYTLPEILRVHANHTRHHARLAVEALAAAGAGGPAA